MCREKGTHEEARHTYFGWSRAHLREAVFENGGESVAFVLQISARAGFEEDTSCVSKAQRTKFGTLLSG